MSAPPTDSSVPDGSGESPRAEHAEDLPDRDPEIVALQQRVERLETELDQKDAELDEVRRHYEALLERRVDDTVRSDAAPGTRQRRTVDLDGLLAYLR